MFLLKRKLQKFKSDMYWLLKGPYQPKSFWERWAGDFIHEPIQRILYPEHPWILSIIKRDKPSTFLEVGCGFGRNIKFILENYPYPLIITGVDFSKTMIENAQSFLHSVRKKPHSFTLEEANVLNLPFPDKSFDITLSHGVLMHIKPENIQKAISELVRVTKKTLIIIEQNDTIKPLSNKPFEKINYFTYTYPYKKLFSAHQVKIHTYRKTKHLDWFLIHVIQKKKKL